MRRQDYKSEEPQYDYGVNFLSSMALVGGRWVGRWWNY